jgi:hypothetical protein
MAFVIGVSSRDGLFVVVLLEGRRWVSDGDDMLTGSSCRRALSPPQ